MLSCMSPDSFQSHENFHLTDFVWPSVMRTDCMPILQAGISSAHRPLSVLSHMTCYSVKFIIQIMVGYKKSPQMLGLSFVTYVQNS